MNTTVLTASAWLTLSLTVIAQSTPPGIMPRPEPPAHGGSTQPPPQPEKRPQPPPSARTMLTEFPAFDGSGNNKSDSTQGAAGQPFARLTEAAYGNGTDSPAGETRPSARLISNSILARPTTARPNQRGATDLFWNWGQFLDHDLDETPTAVPAEAFPILVPAGDPQFDPSTTGTATIGLNRSAHQMLEGVREQINAVTHYIDASMIYGSDEARATALRALDGSGRMKTSTSPHGPLLPLNSASLANIPPGPSFYVAGDVRVNEQPGLLALHTLFVREHNHWADKYKAQNPQADDNEIYLFARSIVAAEIQAITYREYLPLLLGPAALPPYKGYRPDVDATVSNEFATAAYRFGHSTVSSVVLRLGPDFKEAPEGHLTLREAFFNPKNITDHGIDSILRGMAGQPCEELDHWIIDDLRNFLFGAPGAGGLDLGALNIQRGRDHGLPSFNAMRAVFRLKPVHSFKDINPNPAVVAELTNAYGTPENLDLWVAGLAERDRPGSMLGETLHRIIADQFRRSRDGDRFWYQHHLPRELVRIVEQQTLATIIRRNTRIRDELPVNPWIIKARVQPPRTAVKPPSPQ